jgi:hypothetical protein
MAPTKKVTPVARKSKTSSKKKPIPKAYRIKSYNTGYPLASILGLPSGTPLKTEEKKNAKR